ncbi:MAG: RNA polymerase sigma factor [Saprospiraceae bacterium]|jgi:RNA polymerase sigma-70 factor (ECF subfamily)|nr:RNA polymerase sigma factor [Saprospiraceae bacterium]
MNHHDFKTKILPIKNRLFRFALGIVGQAAEAEDVVQEVFIKLWNNRQQLDAISNVEAWCITATRNLSIDKLRSKHQRLQPMAAGFDLHDQSATPYEAVVSNDVISQVRNLMSRLPEKQRDIMQLRDIEGLSYQEISDTLDVPMDQVKVYLFRARKAVRAGLEV